MRCVSPGSSFAAEDVRWMLALLAPRILARTERYFAQLGLDAKRRISPSGQRLAMLLGGAELEGIVGSGVRRDKQTTSALLDERLPATRPRSREGALRELRTSLVPRAARRRDPDPATPEPRRASAPAVRRIPRCATRSERRARPDARGTGRCRRRTARAGDRLRRKSRSGRGAARSGERASPSSTTLRRDIAEATRRYARFLGREHG